MITKKSKKLLLELRREEVLQLTSRGYSQRDIAKRIGISPSLVNNDLKYLRIKARQNISEYINKILPTEMELSLVRLQQIIKKCFEDIESISTTTKEKHEAAIIIKECSALRLEILGSGVLANELSNTRKHALVSNSSVSYSGRDYNYNNNNNNSTGAGRTNNTTEVNKNNNITSDNKNPNNDINDSKNSKPYAGSGSTKGLNKPSFKPQQKNAELLDHADKKSTESRNLDETS